MTVLPFGVISFSLFLAFLLTRISSCNPTPLVRPSGPLQRLRMLCRPTSLPQHPCPYVGRRVQDRDTGGLALVEKTDALDVHEIDLLQIQRHPGLPSLELGPELAKVLGCNLATQP